MGGVTKTTMRAEKTLIWRNGDERTNPPMTRQIPGASTRTCKSRNSPRDNSTQAYAVQQCMRKAFEWLRGIHVVGRIMAKVVQTDLEEEEYRLFKELLEKQRLSIREGLRLAIDKMVKEE